MMRVAMLGGDYRYSLSAYERGGSTFGADYAALQKASDAWAAGAAKNSFGFPLAPTSNFDAGIVSVAKQYGVTSTDLYNYIMKIPLSSTGTSTGTTGYSTAGEIIAAVNKGILSIADAIRAARGLPPADQKAVSDAVGGGFASYTPWLIGGAAVLIMGMFLLGTRR